MTENQYGKVSNLDVECVCMNGRTHLYQASFTAPFKIMKPFYVRKDGYDRMQLMIISVSAGIMAGDVQNIHIRAGDNTAVEVNSQSYEKIHRMPEGEAVRSTKLSIGRRAFCYYNPLPVIPFADSAFTSETEINMADDTSQLVYREILSGGRHAYNENFAYRSYKNQIRILRQNRLLYFDNTIFEPDHMDMGGYGMMEGYTHLGTMIFCCRSCSGEMVNGVRAEIENEGICGGISVMDGGIIVLRMFAVRADDMIRFFDWVYERVELALPV